MRCSLQKSATTTSCSLALVVLGLAACGERDPRPQVFVAASLHRVVADIVDELGLEVRIGTAASSTLARQIQHGANAAVFLSANREWMDYLAERQLVVEDTRRGVAKNRLVWVAQSDKLLRERGSARRVAMGDPAHVPVGQYAKAYLQQRGEWEQYEDRMLMGPDASSVLRLVERGEADLGLVYLTDAVRSRLPWIPLQTPPGGEAAAVVYECAIVRSGDSTATRRIYQALIGEVAHSIYARHGFVPDAR